MKYRVYFEAIKATDYEVEAHDKEEARLKARELWKRDRAVPTVLSIEENSFVKPVAPHTTTKVTKARKCNFCENEALYDASTHLHGAWAYMCGTHFKYYGCELGLGKGQKLVKV